MEGVDISQSSPSLPPDLREAEATLGRLRGVLSSRIVVGAGGEIAEVHVMATAERGAKQIVRDVESALFANFGVRIDHRKISVAVMDDAKPGESRPAAPERPRVVPREEGSAGVHVGPGAARAAPPRAQFAAAADAAPAPRAAAAPPRLRYVGLNVKVSGGGSSASVELMRGGLRVVGDSTSPAAGTTALRSIAEATLRAVMHCYEAGPALSLEEIVFAPLAQRQAVVVAVACHVGRETTRLLGATFVGDDPQQAVICATLDAVNRFSGRMKEREFVEIEVGPALASS